MYYSKEHTWLRLNSDNNTGVIGITDFAQKELGEIVYVEFPNVGDEFKQDEAFGSVEAVKTVSDLFMPVSGTVTKINEDLNNNPTTLNKSPFEDGWLIEIKIKDQQELEKLLNQSQYDDITR